MKQIEVNSTTFFLNTGSCGEALFAYLNESDARQYVNKFATVPTDNLNGIITDDMIETVTISIKGILAIEDKKESPKEDESPKTEKPTGIALDFHNNVSGLIDKVKKDELDTKEKVHAIAAEQFKELEASGEVLVSLKKDGFDVYILVDGSSLINSDNHIGAADKHGTARALHQSGSEEIRRIQQMGSPADLMGMLENASGLKERVHHKSSVSPASAGDITSFEKMLEGLIKRS